MRTVTQGELLDFAPEDHHDGLLFDGLDMRQMDLAGSQFTDCVFLDCNLGDAKLNGGQLKNCRFEDVGLQGTDFFGVQIIGCKLMAADFTKGTRLVATGFSHVNLDYAIFRGVNLSGLEFSDCSLREADLSLTDLRESTLVNCDLDRVEWTGSLTQDTDVRGSQLRGLDLRVGPHGFIFTTGQVVSLVEDFGVRVMDIV
ncbi:MAG: pentapeptide repeat-containing protein [Actinomycetota bacterium]|jgi:fluoroquinolone resistance protein|nr:pentapeptide repeat-containing protein [Actinomycetota bacterium]